MFFPGPSLPLIARSKDERKSSAATPSETVKASASSAVGAPDSMIPLEDGDPTKKHGDFMGISWDWLVTITSIMNACDSYGLWSTNKVLVHCGDL